MCASDPVKLSSPVQTAHVSSEASRQEMTPPPSDQKLISEFRASSQYLRAGEFAQAVCWRSDKRTRLLQQLLTCDVKPCCVADGSTFSCLLTLKSLHQTDGGVLLSRLPAGG